MTLSVCCQCVDDRLHIQAFASPTHHFVNLVRCDTRPHCSMSLVQDLPGNQACFADACYLLRGVDRHCVDIQRASAFSSTSTDQAAHVLEPGFMLSCTSPLFWALLRISLMGSPLAAYSGLGMLSGTCKWWSHWMRPYIPREATKAQGVMSTGIPSTPRWLG